MWQLPSLCIFALLVACTAHATDPEVSILVALHRAPVHVLRATWRDLEDLLLASTRRIEVLWTWAGVPDDLSKDAVISLLGSRNAYARFLFVAAPENNPACLSCAYNRFVASLVFTPSAQLSCSLARVAKGSSLYLLSEFVHLSSSPSLDRVLDALSNSSVGVATNKIMFDDGTIAAAGMEFLWARNPNKQTSFCWGDGGASSWRNAASRSGQYGSWRNRNSRVETRLEEASEAPLHKTKVEVPILYFPFRGLTRYDSRVSRDRVVSAAPFFSFAVSRDTFWGLHGFNDSYMNAYFDADFCLRMHDQRALATVYVASSEVVMTAIDEDYGFASDWSVDNSESEHIKPALAVFTDAWVASLGERLDISLVLHNLSVVWSMDCGSGQVLGFTTEATNIVSNLFRAVRTKVVVANSDECRSELRRIGFPYSTRKLLRVLEDREDRLVAEDIVAVLHKDPGRYGISLYQEPFRSAAMVVGRSMYETTSIPRTWVEPCNEAVDAVWVPSAFNMATFAAAGVNASKLFVVPETVDFAHFDPDAHQPTLNRSRFRFLSVSKWERRKAWEVLLQAYFEEFEGEPGVVLTFRSSMNADNMKQYSDFVANYAGHRNITASELPKVELLRSLVPYAKMPGLYKSADAFVLASHGEGWGLPLMEAMSMDLPTIATNWSGNTQFMTQKNSILVSVEKLTPIPDSEPGHQWALPSTSSLRHALRSVFRKQFNREAVRHSVAAGGALDPVLRIVELLTSARPHLAAYKRARESKLDHNTWNTGFQHTGNTGSTYGGNTGWSGWSGSTSQQSFVDAAGKTRVRVKINQ